MSKGKKKQTNDDYPFDEANWERWNNSKRLEWMRNFRDKLRANDDAIDCRGTKTRHPSF